MKYLHIGIVGDMSAKCDDIAKQIYNFNSLISVDMPDHNHLMKYVDKDIAFHITYPFGKYSATDIGSVIVQSCLENKDVVIIVYDSTDRIAFSNIRYWLHTTKKWAKSPKKILLSKGSDSDGKYFAEISQFDAFFEISPCNKINDLYNFLITLSNDEQTAL